MRPPAAKSVTSMAAGYALGLLLGGGQRGPVVDTLCVLVAALLFAAAVWGAWREWRMTRFSDSPVASTIRVRPAVCGGPYNVEHIDSDTTRLVCMRQRNEAMCVACPERGQQP